MSLHAACRENNASPLDSHVLRTNGTNLCLLDIMNGVLEMIPFHGYCGNGLKLQCFTVVRKALYKTDVNLPGSWHGNFL